MADLLDRMIDAHRADVDSEPLPRLASAIVGTTVVDRLAEPCECGAAAVAMVYQHREGGHSVRARKCRDCMGGAA